MLKTKAYLKKYNLNIGIITNPNLITEEFNIFHIFNYPTYLETYEFFKNEKKINVRLLLLPFTIVLPKNRATS
jgi:hypothetical protein